MSSYTSKGIVGLGGGASLDCFCGGFLNFLGSCVGRFGWRGLSLGFDLAIGPVLLLSDYMMLVISEDDDSCGSFKVVSLQPTSLRLSSTIKSFIFAWVFPTPVRQILKLSTMRD
jgi:hypothetical protein